MSELKQRIKDHLRDQTILNDGATVLNPFGLPCVPITGFISATHGFIFDVSVLNDDTQWDDAMLLSEQQLGPAMVGLTRGIGTWSCGKHVHIDAVQWTSSRQCARLGCILHEQQAYYDIEKGESVYVRTNDSEEI